MSYTWTDLNTKSIEELTEISEGIMVKILSNEEKRQSLIARILFLQGHNDLYSLNSVNFKRE